MILLILSGSTGLPENVYWFPGTAQNLVNQKFFLGGGPFFAENIVLLNFFFLRTLTVLWSVVSMSPEGQWNMLVICAPIVTPQFPSLASSGAEFYSYPASFSSPKK